MNPSERVALSKFLSYVLRHAPQSIGLTLDRDGWAEVQALLRNANDHGRLVDLEMLREVVENDEKRRFTLSDDARHIRAAQGHSTDQVAVQHVEKLPPALLYHGTASRFMASIEERGLLAGARHHVHLSEDPQVALTVGRRYGEPVLLEIDTRALQATGARFYQADNGVWLVASVPVGYWRRSQPGR
ncbi:RNA 2'-phosphotransferase [Pseudomonas sp. S75]|uniref:RNA 2'-phosphotransferase n=1 Tax=unclassified Pseudomonas TaxID=196821 RepID=UPI001906F7F7|nr:MULTISPECIES: RNA 2'-phosphotransferase [unclassified Pseudomonas]MBJ9978290.1 RNA 2'-phosphotransferase [Pseudomonas sp. S30]MBK0156172.1 RNA 2'-phosphotransferase [Pseudomonas sp. S75]